MCCYKRAVFIFEEDAAIPEGAGPLMLETVLDRPVLSWACGQLRDEGVQRFFAVCGPRFFREVRTLLPPEAVVSEQWGDLSAFLDTEEPVLVLPRAAFPMAEAGPGFAYAAAGRDLAGVWKDKMTNNVQGAELVSGWLPVYSRDTVAEIEALMERREK